LASSYSLVPTVLPGKGRFVGDPRGIDRRKRCHNARFRYFSGAGFACMHPLFERANR